MEKLDYMHCMNHVAYRGPNTSSQLADTRISVSSSYEKLISDSVSGALMATQHEHFVSWWKMYE